MTMVLTGLLRLPPQISLGFRIFFHFSFFLPVPHHGEYLTLHRTLM